MCLMMPTRMESPNSEMFGLRDRIERARLVSGSIRCTRYVVEDSDRGVPPRPLGERPTFSDRRLLVERRVHLANNRGTNHVVARERQTANPLCPASQRIPRTPCFGIDAGPLWLAPLLAEPWHPCEFTLMPYGLASASQRDHLISPVSE